MSIKVGINGFGRIGRLVFRAAVAQPETFEALKISPDYLLQDELEENEISTIREIEALWKDTSPSKQELAFAMIKAVLEYKE